MRTDTAFEAGAVIGFKDTQTGFEQLASGNNDDIETRRDLVTTENLSYQAFSSVSLNGATELLGRRNPQTSDLALVRQHEQCGKSSTDSGPVLVDLLELRTPMDPLVGLEPSQTYSLLTVRRLRPFARRRLRTSRPFFVLMRTRNPWVRRRWRLFGWNVRFPFMRSLYEK
ncbi:MAG: hypothetical protein A3G76_12190 [Acidobacteria bacterium RIFCSPLOWO2_12_FULL_65_11]|nr:MAG: hypothetical protein A3H95_05440 [Acidobacteria bacterium RIFCSPLOWO2_02_FULL_64_15]OFW31555.1 MAG: hypothetical protein A3G76_12190 [Acidobacteria bacterium RIFCSPLOWO2_12_FULL_65_11]